MLSIDDCRQTLGRPDLTDEQVVQIRDTLYGLAHAFVDEYFRRRREGHP